MNHYVYAYVRKDGSPYYIGKGKGIRAWATHLYNHKPKDKERIVIMERGLTEIGAFALERFYIRWYGRKDKNTGILRNLTDGGEGGGGRPKGISFSDEHKKKLSDAHIGHTPWNKGKTNVISEEARQKISKSLTGHKQSEATKIKRANSIRGKTFAHKGKPWSEARRAAQQKMGG